MALAPYETAFDFTALAPPSILPFVGMLIVGAMGVVLVFWRNNAPSRVVGALIAAVAVGVGTTDLLNARSEYTQISSDIASARVETTEGTLRVTEQGAFSIGARTFSLPLEPGTRRIYAMNPDEVARFEGMCAEARSTNNGQLTWLGVREPVGEECAGTSSKH